MTRPDPNIANTARLVENLAELMPQVRQHARLELHHLDGHSSRHPGASNPDETPSRRKPLDPDRRCTHNVPSVAGEPLVLVDCGRRLPCAEHSTPVNLTPVERAADERIRIERWIADIEQQCKLLASVVSDALTSGRKLIGTRTSVERPRCDATGRDGAIEWADATCVNVPSRGSLCDRCSKREWRWRNARGLPARNDGVFSQPDRGEMVR